MVDVLLVGFPPLQDAHGMYLDEAKVIVDVECERLLPGWTPRRLGE